MAEYINVTLIDNIGEHIMHGLDAEDIISSREKAFIVELKNLLDLRYTQCDTLEDAVRKAIRRKGAEVIYLGSLVDKKVIDNWVYFYDKQCKRVKRLSITS